MKTNPIYYDTEFLEGTQDIRFLGLKTGLKTKPTIDLISIGMVKETGEEYYAISKDFNLKEAWNRYDIKTEVMSGDARDLFPYGKKTKVYWIRENVLKPIFHEWQQEYNGKIIRLGLPIPLESNEFTYRNFKKWLKIKGKSNKEIAAEVIEFCSTEEVVIGNPYDLIIRTKRIKHNKEIELYGYYSAYDHVALCWLFGKMIDLPPGFPMYTIDLKQKSDISPDYPKQTNEHSAIHDARFNKKLHEFLNNI